MLYQQVLLCAEEEEKAEAAAKAEKAKKEKQKNKKAKQKVAELPELCLRSDLLPLWLASACSTCYFRPIRSADNVTVAHICMHLQ